MNTANATSGRTGLNIRQWRFARYTTCLLRPLLRGCFALIWAFTPAAAQETNAGYHINILTATPVQSIRGLSVVTDDIVWASGTGGRVGNSTDGGKHWKWVTVSGCDSCDWRSLYAFNDRKAIVLNAGAPALIFLTEDGGDSWKQVFYDNRPGIFFDAMQFFNEQEGIAIGDPIEGRFIVIRTHNGGLSWKADPVAALPRAAEGEAIFAASGTSLVLLPENNVYFATGGQVARLFKSGDNGQAYTIPLVQGSSTTGVFSIAFRDAANGIAVGGDYKQDTARKGNCMLTSDGGRNWKAPATPPGGYRSCVAWINPQLLIATGTSGTDISTDGGHHWKTIGKGFNVAAKARKGTKAYVAGKDIGELANH
ncbi:oxidoreductase [Chitinophaga sp.]|uniref:WD40/YVTN/BNR-like repeat-containing protein n=1 Tax=Chitinophaga sp. TaxID=1869181 RepID=UPI002F93CA82